MTRDCDRARELLHDRFERRLSNGDGDYLERHLEQCEECRSEAEELEALRVELSRLPRELEPERDLWAGIEHRLEPTGWWRSASLLAAAAAILALGLGFWLWRGAAVPTGVDEAPRAAAHSEVTDDAGRNEARAEMARSEDGMLLAHQDLLSAVQSQSDRLSPETVAAVEENMRIIDQAIGQIRTALEDDPLNQRLNMLLAAQYQHEVQLLKRVSGV